MANTYYDRVIRKLVIGFGNLFDGITLVRYNPDNTEAERFIVPIAYAAKELYVQRLEGDPNLDKKVQMTLPRMSFEMNGLSYDASRKQITNLRNFNVNAGPQVISQYVPVPYNFDFDLNIYVRNIEDGTQIIEKILPFFTPDYTIKLNLIPEMGIVKEIPIILNQVNSEVTYEGNRDSDTRMIVWTLNFTVKGFIFGASSPPQSLIKTSITNIYNDISSTDQVVFNMANTGVGFYQAGEIVYQGYNSSVATATATVVEYNRNSQLILTNINGNFVSNQPIIGSKTNTNYTFLSYQVAQSKYSNIVITPTPPTANANSKYGYVTTITEANSSPIISYSNAIVQFTATEDLLSQPGVIDLLNG